MSLTHITNRLPPWAGVLAVLAALAAVAAGALLLHSAAGVSAAPRLQSDSTDATLSALTLTGGTRIGGLDPAFDSATETYTSAVLHGTSQVTVTATANDSNAGIAYNTSDAHTDAGHQVNLSEGSNTITVTVTAQDTSVTKTYTITVWKHPEIDDWLVRNKFSEDGNDRAQPFSSGSVMTNRFTTGPSEEGYTINAVRLKFTEIPDPPGDWGLEVRKRSDNSVVGGFHIQRTSRTTSDWEIPATEPFTLDANTEYAVRIQKGAGTWSLLGYRVDDPGAHSDSFFGWSIDNNVCLQDDCGTLRSDRMLVFRLRGTAVDTTAPVLQTAEVDGDTLTLTYDEALDERITPPTSAFTVTSDTTSVTVDSVDVSGSTVVLTLAGRVGAGDTVTMTYTVPGSNAIVNAANIEAAAITSSQTVTNSSVVQTDATLSALDVTGGTRKGGLNPAFASATLAYTSAVRNATSQVTVTATATDSANATIAYMPSTDAHTDAGHQVDLAVGENTITVTVTAEDGSTTETYTITVWRHSLNHSGGNTILRNHGSDAQYGLTLTGNIAMTRFTTGPSAEGYVVNALRLHFSSAPSSPGRWTLDIRKDSDNTVVGTFHVLGLTVPTVRNAAFYYATSPIELDASTTTGCGSASTRAPGN